jgi:signal recognition particle subunit SRP68
MMDLTSYVASERDAALLVGDYKTYRAQATRRIHSLRKRLGQVTPKGRKYATKSPITAADIGRDNGYMKILILGEPADTL